MSRVLGPANPFNYFQPLDAHPSHPSSTKPFPQDGKSLTAAVLRDPNSPAGITIQPRTPPEEISELIGSLEELLRRCPESMATIISQLSKALTPLSSAQPTSATTEPPSSPPPTAS